MAHSIDTLFDKREKIKTIAQMMEETGLTRIKFTSDGEDSSSVLELERGGAPVINNINNSAPANAPAAQPTAAEATELRNAPAAEKIDGTPVRSPMVGVFYAAPSPDEDPFVKIGDKVKKGDVLCIVEAMKLMNEITAEQDGVIAEICAEDGALVEFGQTLFILK